MLLWEADTGGRLSPLEEAKLALVTCTKICATGLEEAARYEEMWLSRSDAKAGVSCEAMRFSL